MSLSGGIFQNAAAATANGLTVSIQDDASFVFTVTGTFVGTLTFEGTEDGTNWDALLVNREGSTAAAATTATAPGLYIAQVAGLQQVRARVSAYTSGTVTVTGHGGIAQYTPPGSAGGGSGGGSSDIATLAGTAIDVNSGNKSAGTQRVVVATDQPTLTNPWKVDPSAVTSPVSIADGQNTTFGAKADVAASSGTVTAMALLKSMAAALALPLAVKPNNLEVTASITGTGVAFTQDASGYKTLSIQLTGTYSCTTIFEQSDDNTNWAPMEMFPIGAVGTTAAVTAPSAITAGTWTGPILSRYVRFRCSAYTSGTQVVTAELSSLPHEAVAIAAFNTQSGTSSVQLQATTAGGTTPYHLLAAATTNAQFIKAALGQVYGISITNSAAYSVYVKLFNKASAPTVGTDTPVVTVECPANSSVQRQYAAGSVFGTGIAICMTKLMTDLDTTVLVAGDCIADVDYK